MAQIGAEMIFSILMLSSIYRPLQISCMVMTGHITWMQMTLHGHENLSTVLITLFKNNLNLPMRSSFFFCLVVGCLLLSFIMLSCLLPHCTALICLFVFTETDFVAQPWTRYLLVNLKVAFHLSYFTDGKNIVEWVHWVYV